MRAATTIGTFSAIIVGLVSIGVYFIWPPAGIDPDLYSPKRWSDLKDSDAIVPVKINIAQQVLDDLATRIRSPRLVDGDTDIQGLELGIQGKLLKKVLDHWSSKYDWRKHESNLNKLGIYKTVIEGLEVHFIHTKPESSSDTAPASEDPDLPPPSSQTKKNIIPLLLIPGFPMSISYYSKLIPLLTAFDKQDVAFEVVVADIPTFSLGPGPQRRGFDNKDASRILNALMARLGHEVYHVHGMDLGGQIGRSMAVMYPQRVSSLHQTFPYNHYGLLMSTKLYLGMIAPSLIYGSDNPQDYQKLNPENFIKILNEMGYYFVQALKPLTMANALSNDPVGLAAYVLEKTIAWTGFTSRAYMKDPEGTLARLPLDDVLTNLMMYWYSAPKGLAANFRFWHEISKKEHNPFDPFLRVPVTEVPTAVLCFPDEILCAPKRLMQDQYQKLIQYKQAPKGGSFPAIENPQILADDLRAFIKLVVERRTYFPGSI